MTHFSKFDDHLMIGSVEEADFQYSKIDTKMLIQAWIY